MLLTTLLFAGNYDTINNYDYPGNDIIYYKGVNLDYCRDNCNRNTQCIGFVTVQGGVRCWLKRLFRDGKPAAFSLATGGRFVYIKLDTSNFDPNLVLKSPQKDAYGGDNGYQWNAAFGQCYSRCLSANKLLGYKFCYGYVFDLGAGMGCWFKGSTLPQITRTPNIYRQVNQLK